MAYMIGFEGKNEDQRDILSCRLAENAMIMRTLIEGRDTEIRDFVSILTTVVFQLRIIAFYKTNR